MKMNHPSLKDPEVKNSDIPAALAEFVAKLDELPTADYKALTDFGINWPAGKFTDPKAEATQKAVAGALKASPGITRRRLALALNFHRPKSLDVTLRKLGVKINGEGRPVPVKAAAETPVKEAAPAKEAAKPEPPLGSRPAKRAEAKKAAAQTAKAS
jgi:hypothetical protein